MVVTAVIAVKAQQEQRMTVNELFELVESNSKTLQSQKISVEFAQKGIEVARTARLPEVNASASLSLNGDVLVTDRDFTHWEGYGAPRWGNSLAVEAQQVVYAGGAIDAGIRLAELHAEQAAVGVSQSREQQRLLASSRWKTGFALMKINPLEAHTISGLNSCRKPGDTNNISASKSPEHDTREMVFDICQMTKSSA